MLMLNFLRMILSLTFSFTYIYIYIQLYEYIVNVYFELIPLGQCLFVFDCNIMILQFSDR